MNAYAFLAQLLELVTALLLAPLLTGWVNQCRAWLQNRSAPPLLQSYYTLSKLFRKDVLLAPRQETRWPGALEPGESDASPSRRKLVPPGVPDPAVVADPASTPADIALSATGTRVRGRR